MSRLSSPKSTTSDIRKQVPTNKLGGKNEWKAMIDQQAYVGQLIMMKEKEKKEQKAKELSATLTQIVVNETAKKERNVEQVKQEKQNANKEQAEYERQLRQNKDKIQQTANNVKTELFYQKERSQNEAEKQRNYDHKIENKMVKNSMEAIQKAQEQNYQKRNNLKQAVAENIAQKDIEKKQAEEQHNRNQNLYKEQATQMNYTRYLKDQAYQQYYKNVQDAQQEKVDTHSRQVYAVNQDREKKLKQFVEKGVEDENNKQRNEYYNQAAKAEENKKELGLALRSRMGVNEYEKVCERQDYPKKVAEGYKEMKKYRESLIANKQEKLSQQKDYKLTLDQQAYNLDEARRNADRMTEDELKMNQRTVEAYLTNDVTLEGFIPGLSTPTAKKLTSPQLSRKNSFSSNSGSVINRLSSPHSRKDSINPITGAPNPYSSPVAQPEQTKPFGQFQRHNSFSETRSNYGSEHSFASTSSSQHRFGMRKNSQVAVSTKSGSHNPILNPVNNYNQNPYIQKEALGNRGASLRLAL